MTINETLTLARTLYESTDYRTFAAEHRDDDLRLLRTVLRDLPVLSRREVAVRMPAVTRRGETPAAAILRTIVGRRDSYKRDLSAV